MAACLISTGKPVLIIVGMTFMLSSVGAGLIVSHQLRSTKRKAKDRKRVRYPREGVLLGGERVVVRPPGRGALIRRSHPPTLIQVADTDADGR
jgi:hypothetical protein